METQPPPQAAATAVMRVVVGVAADPGVAAIIIPTCMRLPLLKVPSMNSKVVATTPIIMVALINNLYLLHPLTKRGSAIIVCIELPSMSVSSLSARIVEPIL
jgi:hypothetical protein